MRGFWLKRLAIGLAVVLCAGLVFFLVSPDVLVESYFWHRGSRITDEDIGKIKEGMHRSQVAKIFGRPADISADYDPSVDFWYEPEFTVVVDFYDNRVKRCYRGKPFPRPPSPGSLNGSARCSACDALRGGSPAEQPAPPTSCAGPVIAAAVVRRPFVTLNGLRLSFENRRADRASRRFVVGTSFALLPRATSSPVAPEWQ